MKYLRYLKVLLRHKWEVFLECSKEGITIQGILHDMSKFLPSEFVPYAKYFFDNNPSKEEFKEAVKLHNKRNRHHWEWWVAKDCKATPMDKVSRLEMLCDWKAVSKTYGEASQEYYLKKKDHFILHPDTRRWLEYQLNIFPNL